MIRITELRLPIDHAPEALEAAILKRLQLTPKDLISFDIFKRSYDARKNVALAFIYTIDASVKNEEALLKRFSNDHHIRQSPDTSYHFVASAPQSLATGKALRPVVIGFGPCGIFAALVLAQMGFKPIILERGKQVRERTRDPQTGKPGCTTIFVLPPSRAELERRLRGRGTDSDAVIARRLQDAVTDMEHHDEFDYVIVNEDFERAVADLRRIVAGNGADLSARRPALAPLLGDLLG